MTNFVALVFVYFFQSSCGSACTDSKSCDAPDNRRWAQLLEEEDEASDTNNVQLLQRAYKLKQAVSSQNFATTAETAEKDEAKLVDIVPFKHRQEAVTLNIQEKLAVDKDFAADDPSVLDECAAKYSRLSSLDNQDLSTSVGQDPLFPPSSISIASPGDTCGDTAQGIAESCDKYNDWKTFQQVATQMGYDYSIIGPSGISFGDIDQGALGNCYFLAALAAIAVHRPEILDAMFVDRHLWDQNIFKTKWFLFGKELVIAVDNMIPAGDTNTYFTQPSHTGEFWPVVLAKAWAKIFGNFKVVEGGLAEDVVNAITGAPYFEFDLTESIWTDLLAWVSDKYPLTAGTCADCNNPQKYGLSTAHAYSIVGAYTSETYGQVVQMYNPWGRNNYNGSVPNTPEVNGDKPGLFTMTLGEFIDAYQRASGNYVKTGYKPVSTTVPVATLKAQDVTVSTVGIFWISLVYPSQRFMQPCTYLNPASLLKAQLSTSAGDLVGSLLDRYKNKHDYVLQVTNSAGGTYNVLDEVTFRDNVTWIDTVALVVYAPGVAVVADNSAGIPMLLLDFSAPVEDGQVCNVITVPGRGAFSLDPTNLLRGVPTYLNSDDSQVLYYVDSVDQWLCVTNSAEYVQQVQAGGTPHFTTSGQFSKASLICGATTTTTTTMPFASIAPTEDGNVCNVITVPAKGVFVLEETTLIQDLPTYWNIGRSQFLYYVESAGQWFRIGAQYLQNVQQGTLYSYQKYSTSSFTCGCHDDVNGVAGFSVTIPCNQATDTNYIYGNVKCTGAEYSAQVQVSCPASCGTCPGQ